TTAEQLVPGDSDASVDLYERLDGISTHLLSGGQVNGNGAFDVSPQPGADPALFTTAEQLVPADGDGAVDPYAAHDGRTSLVSTAKPDPPAPQLEAASPASPANDDSPALQGSAEAQSTVEVFSDPACSGTPLASGTEASFSSAGIAVPVPEDAT